MLSNHFLYCIKLFFNLIVWIFFRSKNIKLDLIIYFNSRRFLNNLCFNQCSISELFPNPPSLRRKHKEVTYFCFCYNFTTFIVKASIPTSTSYNDRAGWAQFLPKVTLKFIRRLPAHQQQNQSKPSKLQLSNSQPVRRALVWAST